jgi:heptosyltransferase-2
MRVLLVQTSFLGDNILSTPVISAIKNKHPEAELVVLTTPLASPIYENNKSISKIITYDKNGKEAGFNDFLQIIKKLREFEFDIVYSLHRSFRTALLVFLAGIPKRIGFKSAKGSFLYTEKRERPTNEHDVIRNLSLIEDIKKLNLEKYPIQVSIPLESEVKPNILEHIRDNYIVIVPGSVWATKRWNASGYRKVAQKMRERGFKVIVLGANNEQKICDEVSEGLNIINLCGQTSLQETALLIAKSKLLVCNDSMSLHLGSAFKVPTAVIFCATSPKFGFGPWQNSKAEVIEEQGLSCKPCKRHGSHKCPTGTEACMKLDADKVLATIERIVENF